MLNVLQQILDVSVVAEQAGECSGEAIGAVVGQGVAAVQQTSTLIGRARPPFRPRSHRQGVDSHARETARCQSR